MRIRAKIISISHNAAKVCIIKENTACESCSACPKKMGIQDIITVAAIDGIQVGQEVVLREGRNWFTKNKMIVVSLAFVLGMILSEVLSALVSFGTYHAEIDLLGGALITIIVVIVLRIKSPKYLFRIEMIEGGKN
ncbi:MAG: hypothetical protein B6D34_07165 [Candidatus Brocadia sp. UTAMX1]|nr:MAG: hypothetical protein B6D34_07165 [Candidatus Brocadia sp. UTAMX1]